MTKPDKWDEVAAKMKAGFWSDADYGYAPDAETIAQALRNAEKAGMERALEICDATWDYEEIPDAIRSAIRAAKETKP